MGSRRDFYVGIAPVTAVGKYSGLGYYFDGIEGHLRSEEPPKTRPLGLGGLNRGSTITVIVNMINSTLQFKVGEFVIPTKLALPNGATWVPSVVFTNRYYIDHAVFGF